MKLNKPDWVIAESKIAIGCIVSDDFLVKYYRIHRQEFIESRHIRMLIDWCFSHWQKHSEAPKRKIEAIWESRQAQSKIPKNDFDAIEKILTALSANYEQEENDFDPDFELQRATEYFRKRQIEIASLLAEEYAKAGEYDKAEETLKNIELISDQGLVTEIQKSAVLGSRFVQEDSSVPKRLIRPWLNLASLNMIFAEPGIGKTWLALSIAVMLTRDEWEKAEIGPWEVKEPSGTLYIDGEMGEWDLKERLKALEGAHGKERTRSPLTILSANRIARTSRCQIDITKPEWRESIYEFIASRPRIKTVILDNLSALTPGRDENDKKEWDPINQWLISLRHLGLAIILIHHSGKNKRQQRGTSAHDDPMDVILSLSRDKKGGGIWIDYVKARNIAPGANLDRFKVELSGSKKAIKWKEIIDESAD
jgi:hypothetical protein